MPNELPEQKSQALIDAADRGDTEEVKRLLDQNAGVNSVVNGRFPWTPLMHASFRGHIETVRLLLEHLADVNQEDLDFFNAIDLAAGRQHWEIVTFLARAGADIHHRDGSGKSPLNYAAEAGRNDVVQSLLAIR